MKRIILLLFSFLVFPVLASHIVGGEFEIIHISGNQYRMNMILYFDELSGDAGARDPMVTARVFRKRDNAVMMDVVLPLVSQTPVSYTQPQCSNGRIVTTRITYSAVVRLDDDQFNDADGYYIAWERCCRNYGITNIYSQNPQGGGVYAGQTFYLEFPPVVKNGRPFLNSTPRLFPPLNDYACPQRPYYVDFAGVDDDGDSLVYSLVTPLNTKSGDALPPGGVPRPRPYPVVQYRYPFSQNNIMGGVPDLRISRQGFLTVTPSRQGLYVFAVRCEEYRNGEKIGEVRRDFQMLVVDACPQASPPQILGRRITDAHFTYDGSMSVAFPRNISDASRCIQVQVSDPDASRQEDNFRERIKIRAIALNTSGDVSGVLPPVTSVTLINGSTHIFDICFDECPLLQDEPLQIAIVAYDDACSLPLTDTLKVTVAVEPPANQKPYFTTADVTATVSEGAQMSWPIAGRDDDGDPLIISILPDGFAMAPSGMRVDVVQHQNGIYDAQFVWDTRCDIYDFTHRTYFDVRLLLEDADHCTSTDADTMMFRLRVILPPNNSPVMWADLSVDDLQQGMTRKVFDSISFRVFASDADNDVIRLLAQGRDFIPGDYGMSFPVAQGRGNVQSGFGWRIRCWPLDLTQKDIFDLLFIAVDNVNKCRVYAADTLSVRIKVLPPENRPPALTMTSANPELPFDVMPQSVVVGQQISLVLTGVDDDVSPADEMSIALAEATGDIEPVGYHFEPVNGRRKIETTFTWRPDCSVFHDNRYETHYRFKFSLDDGRCFNTGTDTVTVEMTMHDIDNKLETFVPPNFISPDNDPEHLNEFFGMYRYNNETGEFENILPLDNCAGRFVGIAIYNRWGKQVFTSNDRDFRWYPDALAAGVYFYSLKYSHMEFKGSVTVRY